jgi:hypothetical protein
MIAGLEDQIAGTADDDRLAEQGAHPSLQDVAVFVLARVPVQRCGQRPRGHRVFDDREAVSRVSTVDHEPDTDGAQGPGVGAAPPHLAGVPVLDVALRAPHDLDRRVARLRRRRLRFSRPVVLRSRERQRLFDALPDRPGRSGVGVRSTSLASWRSWSRAGAWSGLGSRLAQPGLDERPDAPRGVLPSASLCEMTRRELSSDAVLMLQFASVCKDISWSLSQRDCRFSLPAGRRLSPGRSLV